MENLCPLKNFKECIGESCAWYDTLHDMCAVLSAGL